MIPKIRRGSRTHGLLAYLYGPGKRDEHTDPHLVGSWDGFAPDPGRDPSNDPDPKATLSRLAAALDLRVKQVGSRAPQQHVWHCSVRTAPGDRHLTDEEWGTVASRLVTAVGLAPAGDPDGCRWAAVRHADDHIHIVATMVRGDLRRPRLNYDIKKAQAECRRMEQEWGLRRLNPGDSTAAPAPTSAEQFKAERTGRQEPPRETLRDAVRRSLAGASDEAEFFTRLRETGVRVKLRAGPSGDALGYAVAVPGDRNGQGEPIWYSGSRLATDLSLPKIRSRLTEGQSAHDWQQRDAVRSTPAQARRSATGEADDALTILNCEDGTAAAAQLVGTGEVLDALAQTSPAATRAELRAAARSFERATRSHVRAEQADSRALRSAARGIVHAGGALGRGEDGGATAMLLSTLVLVTIAAARWHSARGHAQQAAAARQSAEHLRAAYQQAAAAPIRALQAQGRALPAADRNAFEDLIRTELARTEIPGAPRSGAHDALTVTLAQAEIAGHDPAALLREAIDQRELATADNISDVLVWRLRRLADLAAHPDAAPRRTGNVQRRLDRWAPDVAQSVATPPTPPPDARPPSRR